MNSITFSTTDDFYAAAYDSVVALLESTEGKCAIGLSGGSTPKVLYEKLAPIVSGYPDARFFIVDERYVSFDDADSNYCMIVDSLFGGDDTQLISIDTSLPINDSISTYADLLPEDGLDLVLLGAGDDGHTASLFPHSPALDSDLFVAHSTTDRFAVYDRIGMTFPYLLRSKELLMLLVGNSKQCVVDTLSDESLDYHEFPVMKLLLHDNFTVYHQV